MTISTHLELRDARDRLIDLLGFAETYPLRDLPVGSDRLTVPFGAVAQIAVQSSQVGVTYSLLEHGAELFEAIDTVEGTGETIFLATKPVSDDVELEVFAHRSASGRECHLYQTAVVKVGLDSTLDAWIRADLLAPGAEDRGHGVARIADYGAQVEVEIADSQEGVDYRLVQNDAGNADDPGTDTVLSGEVRGDLGNIVLVTQALQEDTDIRIRAVKTFDASEQREDQTTLLDALLPMKLRATPDIDLEIPEPIVEHGAGTQLRIKKSQKSATYHVYTRPISDREFARFAASEHGEAEVPVPGEPKVRVALPARDPLWKTPPGFEVSGEPVPGKGETVSVDLAPMTQDTLVLVEARKEHAVAGGPAIPSSMRIVEGVAVLVRPDPAQRLVVRTSIEDGKTSGSLQVTGGQPGVFYHFRSAADGEDLGLPAYFHKLDEANAVLNKGVDQIAEEVDLVIARSRPDGTAGMSLAAVRPEPPLIETGAIEVGTTLHVYAVKAQTRVSRPLAQTLDVAAAPEIQPEHALIDHGARATFVAPESALGESYALLHQGEQVGALQAGDGGKISLVSEPLESDAAFEILVTRSAETSHVLEHLVPTTARVRPDPAVPVRATLPEIDFGAATDIEVGPTQPGVTYGLFAGEVALGDPVPGTGGSVELPTGALEADTTFRVRAAREDDSRVAVVLTQEVVVRVRPEPEPEEPEEPVVPEEPAEG